MTKKKSTGKITLKKTGKKKTSATSVTKVKRPARAFRTYQQAMGYLFDRTDYERQKKMRYNVNTFDLDRMNKFLKALGNPHKKIRTVHIAGTKGKGSTAAMLGKMIEANGYSVGLYTSPHVTTLHERIMINSEMINKKKMLGLMNRVQPIIEKFAAKDESPTFFEIMTALAFLHFADEQVDLAVIETGLGGRLDSTNVVNPEVVGITSISIDHQNLLGSTLSRSRKNRQPCVFLRNWQALKRPRCPSRAKILTFRTVLSRRVKGRIHASASVPPTATLSTCGFPFRANTRQSTADWPWQCWIR
ncbi:MAG: bifunctional folylpolyglutamate synthase/dihydrofolate synthase [Planctomycetota bacterium]|jgi:hypothetical protein